MFNRSVLWSSQVVMKTCFNKWIHRCNNVLTRRRTYCIIVFVVTGPLTVALSFIRAHKVTDEQGFVLKVTDWSQQLLWFLRLHRWKTWITFGLLVLLPNRHIVEEWVSFVHQLLNSPSKLKDWRNYEGWEMLVQAPQAGVEIIKFH